MGIEESGNNVSVPTIKSSITDFSEIPSKSSADGFCSNLPSSTLCGCNGRNQSSNHPERTLKPAMTVESISEERLKDLTQPYPRSISGGARSSFDKKSYHLVPTGGHITGRLWTTPRACYDSIETETSVVFEDTEGTQFLVGSEKPAVFFDDFEPVTSIDVDKLGKLSARSSNSNPTSSGMVNSKSPRVVISPREIQMHGRRSADITGGASTRRSDERPRARQTGANGTAAASAIAPAPMLTPRPGAESGTGRRSADVGGEWRGSLAEAEFQRRRAALPNSEHLKVKGPARAVPRAPPLQPANTALPTLPQKLPPAFPALLLMKFGLTGGISRRFALSAVSSCPPGAGRISATDNPCPAVGAPPPAPSPHPVPFCAARAAAVRDGAQAARAHRQPARDRPRVPPEREQHRLGRGHAPFRALGPLIAAALAAGVLGLRLRAPPTRIARPAGSDRAPRRLGLPEPFFFITLACPRPRGCMDAGPVDFSLFGRSGRVVRAGRLGGHRPRQLAAQCQLRPVGAGRAQLHQHLRSAEPAGRSVARAVSGTPPPAANARPAGLAGRPRRPPIEAGAGGDPALTASGGGGSGTDWNQVPVTFGEGRSSCQRVRASPAIRAIEPEGRSPTEVQRRRRARAGPGGVRIQSARPRAAARRP